MDIVDYCFITTTIKVPNFFKEYAKKLKNKSKIGFITVGDKKTPHKKVSSFMNELKNDGFDSEYLDLQFQKNYIRKFKGLSKIISYNSTTRRNLGHLKAAEDGAKVIVILDDDNYITNSKFLHYISHLGKKNNFTEVKSSIGWFNPCSMLETDHKGSIYMRGFPYSKQSLPNKYKFKKNSGRVVMNLGLWTDDPDVDAVTNLAHPTKIMGLKNGYSTLMVGKKTFLPINTQNTSLLTEILPCFYDVIQGHNFKGLKIDRYSDVWAGFLAKKVIDHMGDKVTVGEPLTRHLRNPHDLLNDLKMELWGMILTEKFVEWIESTDIRGSSYSECYYSLAKTMESKLANSFNDANIRKYFIKLSNAMKIWIGACEKINLS